MISYRFVLFSRQKGVCFLDTRYIAACLPFLLVGKAVVGRSTTVEAV